MNSSAEFFESKAVAFARTLPLQDARTFLLGMLESVEGSAFPKTREAYQNLCYADDQLELIATGQLKLNLGGKPE